MLEKIKPEQMEQYGVVSAPDHLSGNPADVKAIFDRLVKELVSVVVNDIIDAHNDLDEDVNQRIDEVIEELKNVSEINAENLGAQNIALDKKGETTLADQYDTGELAPTVHGALRRILEMFLRKGGDTMAGNLNIENTGPAILMKNKTTGVTGRVQSTGGGNVALARIEDEKNQRLIEMNSDGSLRYAEMIGGAWTNNQILHTGNLEALNMAKVVAGSYTGTGETTKTLTFPFTPKIVYVATKVQVGAVGHLLVINGMERGWNCFSDSNLTTGERATKLSWGEKSLTLLPKDPINSNERDTPEAAMNSSRYEYFYVAIG